MFPARPMYALEKHSCQNIENHMVCYDSYYQHHHRHRHHKKKRHGKAKTLSLTSVPLILGYRSVVMIDFDAGNKDSDCIFVPNGP